MLAYRIPGVNARGHGRASLCAHNLFGVKWPDSSEPIMILGDIYGRNALHSPNHPAIRYEGRTITHRAFSGACRLANALADCSIRPGERVAVLAQGK
jgi:hypothetical protein